MTLFTASIASGSNGNCYFIGNSQEGVLIDMGISCRELEKRMARLMIPMAFIKAVFVTHEHTDHIRGLTTFSKKYHVPVFMTFGTWQAMQHVVPQDLVFRLIPDQPVCVGKLEVLPFSKFHDAAEAVSVVISSGGVNIGVFTDIGQICDPLIQHFANCDVAYLECNYDAELLINGRYPYFLKKRIQGGYGHLSNEQALFLFETYRQNRLKLLFPSHLSRDNNSIELVEQTFQKYAEEVEIVVASRECETPIYRVQKDQVLIRQELTFVEFAVFL